MRNRNCTESFSYQYFKETCDIYSQYSVQRTPGLTYFRFYILILKTRTEILGELNLGFALSHFSTFAHSATLRRKCEVTCANRRVSLAHATAKASQSLPQGFGQFDSAKAVCRVFRQCRLPEVQFLHSIQLEFPVHFKNAESDEIFFVRICFWSKEGQSAKGMET